MSTMTTTVQHEPRERHLIHRAALAHLVNDQQWQRLLRAIDRSVAFQKYVGELGLEPSLWAPRYLDQGFGYFRLCKAEQGFWVPSYPVDFAVDAIHLDTPFSHPFFDALAGRFIHHVPFDDDASTDEVGGLYRDTIAAMTRHREPDGTPWIDQDCWPRLAGDCTGGSGNGWPPGDCGAHVGPIQALPCGGPGPIGLIPRCGKR